MRAQAFAFAVLALLGAVPASSRPAPERPESARRVAPDTPKAAVRALVQAYNERSVRKLEALMSADYRFHISAGDTLSRYFLNGLDRRTEMGSAKVLFEGLVVDGKVVKRPAERITITLGRLEEGADPEHPDSMSHYRVVVAHKLGFSIVDDDTMESLPADQVFCLVRGDVAQRLDGQPGLANRWYIRRWLENLTAVEKRLAGIDGHCEEAADPAVGTPAGVFGVRALDSPLCATLDVACDLPSAEPATLEVFDLQGRRMAKQVLRPTAPGTVRIQAGAGARFAPGAYWLRLTQGRRPASKRLVLVAR